MLTGMNDLFYNGWVYTLAVMLDDGTTDHGSLDELRSSSYDGYDFHDSYLSLVKSMVFLSGYIGMKRACSEHLSDFSHEAIF